MSTEFEKLLKDSSLDGQGSQVGIYKGRVISDIQTLNNSDKSFVLVDINKRKQYMVFVEEFAKNEIPSIGTEIQVCIINNGDHSLYGVASVMRAIQQSRLNDLIQLKQQKTVFSCTITKKISKGYEVSTPNILYNKCILLTTHEYSINDNIMLLIKHIAHNTVYMQHAPITSQIMMHQEVTCKVIDKASIMFMLENQNIAHPNITWILPFTDVKNQTNPFQAKDAFKIGDTVTGNVISISPNRVIISQLHTTGSNHILENIPIGAIIDVTIIKMDGNNGYIATWMKNETTEISCYLSMNDCAWSVSQREALNKANTFAIGNVIKVQIVSLNFRNRIINVTYKVLHCLNPIIKFKSLINPQTNKPYAVGDIIHVDAIFQNSYQYNKSHMYATFEGCDVLIQHSKKISDSKQIPVIITELQTEKHQHSSLRIIVVPANDSSIQFKNDTAALSDYIYYQIEIIERNKFECIVNILHPIDQNGNVLSNVKLDLSNIPKNAFIMKMSETQSNINDKVPLNAKLINIDTKQCKIYFSQTASTDDTNRRIANEHRIADDLFFDHVIKFSK